MLKKILFISVFCFIFITSLITSSVLNFNANAWLSITILLLFFMFWINYFLKALGKKTDANGVAIPLNFYNFSKSLFFAAIASILTLPISNALFALYTQSYGENNKIVSYQVIPQSLFTPSKNFCEKLLKLPVKDHSGIVLNDLCKNDDSLHNEQSGYYIVEVKTSILGSNIQNYQRIADQSSNQQIIILGIEP